MPTANIPVYLPDNQYVRYIKQKEKIHEKVKELVKQEVEEYERKRGNVNPSRVK